MLSLDIMEGFKLYLTKTDSIFLMGQMILEEIKNIRKEIKVELKSLEKEFEKRLLLLFMKNHCTACKHIQDSDCKTNSTDKRKCGIDNTFDDKNATSATVAQNASQSINDSDSELLDGYSPSDNDLDFHVNLHSSPVKSRLSVSRGQPPLTATENSEQDIVLSESDTSGLEDLLHSESEADNRQMGLLKISNSLYKSPRHTKMLKNKESTKKQLCKICGELKVNLAAHIRSHTGERPYACDQCHKCFGRIEILRRHQAMHRIEKFHCIHCKREFSRKDNLNRHLLTHTKSKVTFKCLKCSKMFAQPESLTRHMSIHNGSVFKCRYCERETQSKWDLEKHERIHTGEKPYQCTKCEKAFALSGNLNKHMKTHLIKIKSNSKKKNI